MGMSYGPLRGAPLGRARVLPCPIPLCCSPPLQKPPLSSAPRSFHPVEYVDAVLEAVDKANPRLNCFGVVMAEQARDKLGSLHGVPVSIKDLVDV